MQNMMRIKFNQTITFVLFYSAFQICIAEEPKILSPEKWPTTVEATVTDIISELSDENKSVIKETSKEGLIRFHHGWGTGVRNYYGLWRGNEKLIFDACGSQCPPDDASMKIIEAVWEKLHEKNN